MNLRPNLQLWNDRRAIGGFLSLFGGNKSTSTSVTNTTTNNTATTVTDAYNNTYNRVNNTSVNLGDEFAKAISGDAGGGLDVKQILLWTAGGFALVILIKLVLKRL